MKILCKQIFVFSVYGLSIWRLLFHIDIQLNVLRSNLPDYFFGLLNKNRIFASENHATKEQNKPHFTSSWAYVHSIALFIGGAWQCHIRSYYWRLLKIRLQFRDSMWFRKYIIQLPCFVCRW